MKTKKRLLAALLASLAVVGFVTATTKAGHADVIVDDPLHGFCATCNEAVVGGVTVTPGVSNPPSGFTFTASPGSQSGSLFIDILVPNVGSAPSGLTVTGGAISPASANLVDTSWTTASPQNFLSDFLAAHGFPTFGSASPQNPIGAFLPATQTFQPSATGYFVFQASLGSETLGNPSNVPAGPSLSINQALAQGSVIVAFLDLGTQTCHNGVCTEDIVATANSGALFVPVPVVGAGLPGLVMACGGLLVLARRRRQRIA